MTLIGNICRVTGRVFAPKDCDQPDQQRCLSSSLLLEESDTLSDLFDFPGTAPNVPVNTITLTQFFSPHG